MNHGITEPPTSSSPPYNALLALTSEPRNLLGIMSGLDSLDSEWPIARQTGLAFLGVPPPQAVVEPGSRYVAARFQEFLDNLTVTTLQVSDGAKKLRGLTACLNRWYWRHSSETLNGQLIGSWGKQTQVRPARDIDLLFVLPSEVYFRFQQRAGNRQSQLLQEVKSVLAPTYSRTEVRGDGQVVVAPFDRMKVEIVPAFRGNDGSFIICDANNGGCYTTSRPDQELAELDAVDSACGGKVRRLAKMMKCWQRECNVPLKSFQLERLAIEFMRTWPWRDKGWSFSDWMVRDFLAYLIARADSDIQMPGTNERIPLGASWLTRARSAHRAAINACDHEMKNENSQAGTSWRYVFGSAMPLFSS